jgi:hypothetical protein
MKADAIEIQAETAWFCQTLREIATRISELIERLLEAG